MPPIKILFLAPQPFYRLRGMCIAQRSCLETLSRWGIEVDVLAFPFGEDVDLPGVKILRTPRLPGIRDVPIGPSWQKLLMDIPLLLHAARLCLNNRYPVVHACEESALLMAPLSRLLGFRLIYDMDDILSSRVRRSGFMPAAIPLAALKAWERWTLRRADLVLTNSWDTTEYALRCAGAERVYFYDHAPPLPREARWTSSQRDAFRRARGLTDCRVILYAGNLEPYQGVPLLLQSLPAVLRRVPGARCLIIGGEPAQIENLRRTARQMRLDGNVEFLGKRPLPEAFDFMRAADVLVSPLVQEKAVPMKLYAYLAAGVPIVATKLSGHNALAGQKNAVLAAPEAGALAAAIADILQGSDAAGFPFQTTELMPPHHPWRRMEEDAAVLRQAYRIMDPPNPPHRQS